MWSVKFDSLISRRIEGYLIGDMRGFGETLKWFERLYMDLENDNE